MRAGAAHLLARLHSNLPPEKAGKQAHVLHRDGGGRGGGQGSGTGGGAAGGGRPPEGVSTGGAGRGGGRPRRLPARRRCSRAMPACAARQPAATNRRNHRCGTSPSRSVLPRHLSAAPFVLPLCLCKPHPGDHQDPEAVGEGGALRASGEGGPGRIDQVGRRVACAELRCTERYLLQGRAPQAAGRARVQSAAPGVQQQHVNAATECFVPTTGYDRIRVLQAHGGEVRQLLADGLGEGAKQALAAKGGHGNVGGRKPGGEGGAAGAGRGSERRHVAGSGSGGVALDGMRHDASVTTHSAGSRSPCKRLPPAPFCPSLLTSPGSRL